MIEISDAGERTFVSYHSSDKWNTSIEDWFVPKAVIFDSIEYV